MNFRSTHILLVLLGFHFAAFSQCELDIEIEANSLLLCPNEVLILNTTDTFDTYQWYREGVMIAGATGPEVEISFYDAAAATFYLIAGIDTCSVQSESVFVDGYAFLPIFMILSGRYGFDPTEEVFVLCDDTQYGGPDTLILEIGMPYDTLITWYRNGEIFAADVSRIVVTEPGLYEATGSPRICPGFSDWTLPVPVIGGVPAVVQIREDDGTLYADTDQELFYYQWYFDGSPIDGANSDSWIPEEEGIYNVYAETRVCTSFSPDFNFIFSNISEPGQARIDVFPNPFYHSLQLRFEEAFTGKLFLYDMHGRAVAQQEMSGEYNLELQLDHLPSGVYFLDLFKGASIIRKLIVKGS
jgi:hypothetical protein